MQVPSVPPQVAVGARQVVLLPQHAPEVEQVFPAQHGWLLPPHATVAAFAQTEPVMLGMFCPEATHWPATQQPPPPQVLPGQQAWPGAPQTGQVPALQVAPVEQTDPLARQLFDPGSQQPPAEHVEPAQQGWPGPPQARHRPLPHAV
ncbi:MAG TPA: hypothetical protein PK493_08695, partial [Pseudomonadota bacterium]|nr:hypothetical protein [Pseudomonadota bacterium]